MNWKDLNRQQVGRYAEYFVKMRFVQMGFDVYGAEVDDHGIDFVLRINARQYWDVQVKSIRETGYVFMQKNKFDVESNLLLALVIFIEGKDPDLYLIPAREWIEPCPELKGILVDRNYPGLKSKPEYGINLSLKGIRALDGFRFETIAATLETKYFIPSKTKGCSE